jgi:hypothetical protein
VPKEGPREEKASNVLVLGFTSNVQFLCILISLS